MTPAAQAAREVLDLRPAPLQIVPDEHMARADGRALMLSIRELRLLTELARRADLIVSREELFGLVWGREMRLRASASGTDGRRSAGHPTATGLLQLINTGGRVGAQTLPGQRRRHVIVQTRRVGAVAASLLASVAVAACGSGGSSSSASSSASASSSGSSSAGASSSAAASASGGAKSLTGAGSTLIAPMMSNWQPAYQSKAGVNITYGAVGSGTGIEQITARTVDFGASDAPMTSSQEAACKGCLEIPWAMAAVDIAYHVQGVPNQLHLTGKVLADIWLGKIKTWNDPAIKALNPGVNLPPTPIQPVHRTDGSGDTFAFTNYLSKIDPAFKSSIGNATTVSWPGGLGGKGNSGVGGVLSSTNGSIAYITAAYVLENHFDYGLVQNAAGKYPVPGIASITAAAAAHKTVPSGGTSGISLTDPPASASTAYPISTFTYVLVPKQSRSASVATALKSFIGWAITSGQSFGPRLLFAPLPSGVVSADQSTLSELQ